MAGELMLINPRHKRRSKRRKATRVRTVTTVARNPIRRRRRSTRRRIMHARRNPVSVKTIYRRARSKASGMGGFVSNTLIPSSVGAIGAAGVDFLLANVPLPASLTTGALLPVTRIAGAVGVGYIARMVGGRSFGNQAMSGAIVVTLYDLLKSYMGTGSPAGTMGYPGVAYQFPDGMGAYGGDLIGCDSTDGMGAVAQDLVYGAY